MRLRTGREACACVCVCVCDVLYPVIVQAHNDKVSKLLALLEKVDMASMCTRVKDTQTEDRTPQYYYATS